MAAAGSGSVGPPRAAGLDLDAIFDLGYYTRYSEQIVGRLDALDPAALVAT